MRIILYRQAGWYFELKFFKSRDAMYKFQSNQDHNQWVEMPETAEVRGKKSGIYFSQMDGNGVRYIHKSALYS
jgi:hypothetical protein